jgi:pimeloyl-ACP methyl ester carboxylesterase
MNRPVDQFIDVNGQKTRYWALGDKASTVILIHGISCSVLEWEHVIDVLSKSHRVVALDLIGHGLTDKPSELDYSLTDFAKHVLAFMDAMKIPSASLIGNSLGARLAIECAAIAPERVDALILSAPAAVDNPTLFEFRVAAIPFLGELASAPNAFGTSKIWRSAFADPSFVSKQLVLEKVALAKMPGAGKAFLKGVRNMLSFSGFKPSVLQDTKVKSTGITAPTMIIWGEQDRFLPVSHLATLLKWMPKAESVVLKNCGHVPMIEKPREFEKICLSFLANLPLRKGT